MRGAKRSAKNTAKNISLLVLCGLMGVLCAVNWLMGLNIAQMPADSALRRLHDRFVGGAVGYEIRSSGVSAADPAQMALTVDGKLYGVQYNLTDIDAGITATRSLWSQALTGEGLRLADESELCTALRSGSCALLRYHGAIPMQSIAARGRIMTACRSKHWCMPPVCSGCLSAWQTAGCMLRMQRSRRMHSRRHRRTSAVCHAALREMRMRSIRKRCCSTARRCRFRC